MADGKSTTKNGQVLSISAFILSVMPENDNKCQSSLTSAGMESLPFPLKERQYIMRHYYRLVPFGKELQ